MTMGPDEPQNHDVGFAHDDDLAGDFSDDVRARIKSELEPGERLLWTGRSSPPPKPISPGYYFWTAVMVLLLGIGVNIVWVSTSKFHGAGSDEKWVVGVFFLGIGGVLGFSVFMAWKLRQAERYHKTNVLFAITDRRAIAWMPEKRGGEIRVMSLYRGEIKELARVERPDGSGTLEFIWPHTYHATWWLGGFEHVPDVRRVEAILRNNLMKRDTEE